MEVKLKIKKESFENLVICFHGPGLIGAIVGEYFAEYGRFKYAGYVKDVRIPPASIIINGKVFPTLRFYESERNLLFIVDQDIRGNLLYELAKEIIKLAEKKKIKRIVMINGLEDTKRRILYISNNEEKIKGLLELKDGVITGLPAILLLQNKINSIFLLAGVLNPDIDPESALQMIDFLSNYIKEKVDLTPLIKEIEEFAKMFEQMKVEKKKRIQLERSLYG